MNNDVEGKVREALLGVPYVGAFNALLKVLSELIFDSLEGDARMKCVNFASNTLNRYVLELVKKEKGERNDTV